jgi:hypothetical protein
LKCLPERPGCRNDQDPRYKLPEPGVIKDRAFIHSYWPGRVSIPTTCIENSINQQGYECQYRSCVHRNGLGWALLKSSDHHSTSPPGHIPQYTSTPSSILSSTLINFHQRPSTFINDHQRSSTTINVHQRPSTFINARSTYPRRTKILTILFAPRPDGRYILLRRED